jgi:hypothetical protein
MSHDPIPLSDDDQEFLAHKASAIRALGRNVIRDVVQIGQHLSEVRDRLSRQSGEGDGSWLAWLEREFPDWKRSSAYRFIQVFELGCEFPNLENSTIDLSGLYLLAAPTTPEAVRSEMLARAATEPVSHAEVQRAVRVVNPHYVRDAPKPPPRIVNPIYVRSSDAPKPPPEIVNIQVEHKSESLLPPDYVYPTPKPSDFISPFPTKTIAVARRQQSEGFPPLDQATGEVCARQKIADRQSHHEATLGGYLKGDRDAALVAF